MKLDIFNAFDKLQWNFLFQALKFFNFSSSWINLIKEMVCTSRGSVLINNNPTCFFSSSCGLHQWDPMSPYMFILAEEVLSLQIEQLRSSRRIVPISPVPSTPCHLLYADDILLFLKAHKSGLRSIKDLLSKYQTSYGQCFNLQKSFRFLGNCSFRRAHMISGIMPIPRASLPLVYLGIPIFFATSVLSFQPAFGLN